MTVGAACSAFKGLFNVRFVLPLVALSLLARPGIAQSNLELPTCQWGDCSKFCDPACGEGSVCGVEGKCVQAKTDEQREREAVDRRHQARAFPRLTIGIGYGEANVEGGASAGVFALQVGVRRQLAAYLGVSVHLGAAYARLSGAHTVQPTSGPSYSDFCADVIPYLGPLGRFYVGPALVLGYRHYSEALMYGTHVVTARTRFEVGGRLGLLFGNREQFDLWLQETSSLNDTTLNQTLFGFSVELM